MIAGLPDVKELSPTNLKYTKYFYDLYAPYLANRQQAADDFKSALPSIEELENELKREL